MVVHPLYTDIPKPERFTYPFNYEPHPLCLLAAKEVQQEIARINPQEGKMFGVLVVEMDDGRCKMDDGRCKRLGFLAAYSGLLEGRNDWEYFVPPVYDAQQPDGYFKQQEQIISLTSHLSPLTSKQMSQQLQEWLFHQYQLLNARGEVKDLVEIWQDYYDRPKLRQKYPLPPGGTGDCCAPKLLQYAFLHGLKPVCMAEFWWGPSTATELRQHLNYYPACRGKCKPILTWMLQGLDVDPDPELQGLEKMDIPIVYEDEWLLVVNKPSGLLSVPGRIEQYSVQTVMRQRYPGSFVAHRLDMGTSGLLIVAKTAEVYKLLQEQFVKHQVKKKYLAILEASPNPSEGGEITARKTLLPLGEVGRGTISLPMRPDPMNRPRQVVDMEHGKRAVTDYEYLNNRMVALWPQTGRTHQLRVHCAHPDGLGRPIQGDELYGFGKANSQQPIANSQTLTAKSRLMLHASEIWFRHPMTGKEMHLHLPFLYE